MVAEFYIIAESFAQNTTASKAEIETKIEALGNDFVSIRKYKDTNKLFINPEIYNIPFINNVSISDLLYNDVTANQHLDRDARNMLKKIVTETENNNITSQEVIEVLLPEHNQDLCHGLIAFNTIVGVKPEFQVIYNENGWLNFRRHYLGLYPQNNIFFIDECIKYFPNLYFHERNKTTVGAILHNCPQQIVYHLTALNDKFRETDTTNLNRSQILEHFSINANFDATASLEGNASRKPTLTFSFINDKKETINICCEPHLKLCHNDNYPGDASYSNDRRIYFHEGIATIENNKILIGHIGDHL